MDNNHKPATNQAPVELNLVCGAGGSRAILGSTGAILASHTLGFNNWETLGGISGGSIPSLLLAAGMKPSEMAHHVIEIDFNSMLTPRTHLPGILWAFFLKECAWRRRQERGVLSSEKVGEFVERFATSWPKKYWTVAVAGDRQLLFTADGVYQYHQDGTRTQLSSEPAPVGLAIRASCAVPGIIDAVEYKGTMLLDGGLCLEGRCPVAVVKKQFGKSGNTIVACDVGESSMDTARREHWFWRLVRKIVCGDCCEPNELQLVDADDVVLVHPAVTNVESLEFKLTPDQKWSALMSGFTTAVAALAKTGWVSEAELAKGQSIVEAYAEIERTSKAQGELATRTQSLLSAHGLY